MVGQVLSGIKILDLTHYIAGPFCTKLLADYGADVIKVEKPGEGDGARRMGPFPGDIPDHEKSGLFLYLNTNKKGVTLNLKTQSGVKIFHELVKTADILVESFSPKVMPSLGLDYQTLKKINPSLVMTSISSFGQNGPYRDLNATEITLFALSGQMFKMGDPDREPLKYALNAYQYFAGLIASLSTMALAIRSSATGSGEHIDVSILETIIGDIDNKVYGYAYSGDKGRRATAKNYPVFPFGGFPAKDGYVAIQGSGGRADDWLPRLFEMIGQPEFKKDPRFATADKRTKNIDEFNALLYSWLVDHTKQEIFDEAAKVRYPLAPAYTTEELVNNPHYRERGFFVEIDHPATGRLTYPGAPFRMAEGYAIKRPAPLLGEHNQDVYCGLLGYSPADLSVLRKCGII